MSDRLAPERFLEAQDGVYGTVIDELRAGRKRTHWMWFVFPQIAGLGQSPTSRFYAIASLAQAQDYLAEPVLGERLRQCAALVLDADATTAEEIFGSVDAVKLRSSMTLFHRADPTVPEFSAVLGKYFGDEADPATDERLAK